MHAMYLSILTFMSVGAIGLLWAADSSGQPIAPSQMPADYLASWRFAGNASDDTGIYNASLVGGVSFVEGKRNLACSLDGIDDYVDLPLALRDATDPTINPVTVMCWWRPQDIEQDHPNEVLIGGFWYHWFLSVPVNTPTAYIYNSNADLFAVTSNAQVQPGTWAHIAVAYDVDHTIAIYIDGELRNQGTWQGTFQRAPTYMRIGNRGISSNCFVAGAIDEVALFARALNAEEIRAVYLAQAARNQPPAMANIGPTDLNEGEESTFTVSATDEDGDPLLYSATGLPEGAVFDPDTRVFSWKPSYSQSGQYEVIFTVTDQVAADSERVRMTIHNWPIGDANGDSVVGALDLIIVRNFLGKAVSDYEVDMNEDGQISVLDLLVIRNHMQGSFVDPIPPSSINLSATRIDTVWNKVEVMTVDGSSQFDGSFAASNAADGDAGTSWRSAPILFPSTETLTLDLGSMEIVDRIRLLPSVSFVHLFPSDFAVAVSVDRTTWSQVDVLGGYVVGQGGAWCERTFAKQKARFVRLMMWATHASGDDLPCFQIAEFEVCRIAGASVQLEWTAPGDDGNIGRAASYEIRYGASQIVDEPAWEQAKPVGPEAVPDPADSGTKESVTLVIP